MGLPVKLRSKTNMGGSTLFILLVVLFILGVFVGYASAEERKQELVKVGHIVQSGETLEDIAKTYLPKNRMFLEFREGIYELNYDTVFKGRAPYEVRKGDFLVIQFWAVVDYE